MSTQLQYLLIGACILGFAAMEFITRRYQATVRGSAFDALVAPHRYRTAA